MLQNIPRGEKGLLIGLPPGWHGLHLVSEKGTLTEVKRQIMLEGFEGAVTQILGSSQEAEAIEIELQLSSGQKTTAITAQTALGWVFKKGEGTYML